METGSRRPSTRGFDTRIWEFVQSSIFSSPYSLWFKKGLRFKGEASNNKDYGLPGVIQNFVTLSLSKGDLKDHR